MPNLFDGYRNSPKEAIAFQIAFLRKANMKNKAKEKLNTVHRGTKKAFNWVAKKVGKEEKQTDVPEDWKLEDELKKEMDKLNLLNKSDLVDLFYDELANKVKYKENDNEEGLSIAVIEETSKNYDDIDESLTPASKAVAITHRFAEKFYPKTTEKLENASDEELKEFERTFEDKLKEAKEEDIEEIKNELGVNEITGEAVRKALTKSGGPITMIALMNLSGFGAYLMLSTVMHAIFTTMLGITLPFAAYTGASSALAFLTGPFGILLATGFGGWSLFKGKGKLTRSLLTVPVFLGVKANDKPLLPKKEELPSYLDSAEKRIREKYIDEINDLKNKHSKAKNKYEKEKRIREKINQKRLNLKDKIKKKGDKIKFLEREYSKSQSKVEDIRRKKERKEKQLEKLKRKETENDPEVKRLKEELKLYEDEIKKAIDDKREYEILLEDVEENKDELHVAYLDEKEINEEKNKKIKELENEVEDLKDKKERKIKSEKKKILRSWNVHFDKMEFKSQPLRWTADKHFNERLDIEQTLKELHEMDDPNNMSKSKLTELPDNPSHCKFSLGNRPARIAYKVKNNKIYIKLMYLRKNQDKAFRAYKQ